ncbi:hypothetical protein EQ500_08895 [Lactobacillus sp. XV13L]|nr:hypothetical protein [Lactobacillus sp. XV13L]
MLIDPKGLRYWRDTDDETFIDPKAPQWAKDEFKEYMKKLEQYGRPDKEGRATYFKAARPAAFLFC